MTKLVTMLVAAAVSVPALCSGQDPLGAARADINRSELTRVLAQYEAVAQSPAYSDVLRDEGRVQADIVRERLRMGDFRSGDQIALRIGAITAVQGEALTVEAGPMIDVPTLGPISLEGVLRSELEEHLSAELSRFILSPNVEVSTLIRVSMVGVAQPGFYSMRGDLPLSESLMQAGGLAGRDPGRIQIERGDEVLWSVEDLLGWTADSRTLADLGLRTGDVVILPEPTARASIPWRTIRTVTFYVALPLLFGRSIRGGGRAFR